MSPPRPPSFLNNVEAKKPPAASPSESRLRSAPWQAAPSEPGAAPRSSQPAAMQPSPPAPPTTAPLPPPGFEALKPSAPFAPAPAPMPPPPTPLDDKVISAIEQLSLEAQRLAEQARADALEVGLMVARTILEREVTQSVEALFSLIKSAIRRLGESNRIVVRLCPADADRVQTTPASALTLAHVEVVADESLELGDVLVETEHQRVDARLMTRLTEAGGALRTAVGGR